MKTASNTTGGFRDAWQKQYGQPITDEQAKQYEERLARFVKLVCDIDQRERAPP